MDHGARSKSLLEEALGHRRTRRVCTAENLSYSNAQLTALPIPTPPHAPVPRIEWQNGADSNATQRWFRAQYDHDRKAAPKMIVDRTQE